MSHLHHISMDEPHTHGFCKTVFCPTLYLNLNLINLFTLTG